MTAASTQPSAWARHGPDNCPYDDENTCVDAWAVAHREQLDRFTEEGLANLRAESPDEHLPDAAIPPAPSGSTVDGRR